MKQEKISSFNKTFNEGIEEATGSDHLFTTLSDMSKQHANAGSYTFENPLKGNSICGHTCGCTTAEQCEFNKTEPAPTVSLYNLLDHSYDQLFLLWTAVKMMEAEVRPYKLTRADTYSDLCAWALLLDTAMKEKKDMDSNSWAEKTAKEINETL